MALITSQQLANFYDRYMNIDVTFSREVIKAIRLRAKQTFLRCLGYQWPCIIYSSSMVGAKVIANIENEIFQKIRESNDLVSLRFCFDQQDKADPIAFFVSAKAAGFSGYSDEHPELNFISLKFTQRPSDDLISILGILLEANINASRRKEERIEINPESLRKIGLKSRDALIFIDNVPRKCILRDISFSGAQVLTSGVAKFVLNKEAKIRMDVDDQQNAIVLQGKIVRFEEYEESDKPIGTIGLHFHEKNLPMDFKIRINEYLTWARKSV